MMPPVRRPPLRHVVAALGLAAIGAVALGVSRDPAPPPAAPPSRPLDPAARPLPVAAAPTPPAPVETVPPPPVRTVTGPGIAPMPLSAAPPVRIDPPEKPKPPPPPVRPRRIAPIAMETTAEFTAGEIRVRLPGVAIVAAEEICRDRTGVEWPCGRRALAGVRALVRGKTVECPLPEKVKRGVFVVDCTLAGADLAERIVASGWARALDREGRLGEAERTAEARGLGLHAPAAPNLVDALPAPVEPPPDTTTAPIGAVTGSVGAPLPTGPGDTPPR